MAAQKFHLSLGKRAPVTSLPHTSQVKSFVCWQAVNDVTLVPPASRDQVIVLRGPKAGQRATMLSVDDKDGVLHWQEAGQQRHDWQKMEILGLLVEA